MAFTIAALAISLSLDSFGVGIAYGIRKVDIPLVSKFIICLFSIIYSAMAIIMGGFLYTALPPVVSRIAGVTILSGMGIYILIQALFKADKSAGSEDGESSPLLPQTANNSLRGIEPHSAFGDCCGNAAKKAPGVTIRVLKDPEEGDLDKSGVIDIRESLLLGLALSIDAIGVGVGSALAGLGYAVVPFAIGLFQMLFLYAGIFLGRKAAGLEKLNKKAVSLAPGLLLLMLALLRIR